MLRMYLPFIARRKTTTTAHCWISGDVNGCDWLTGHVRCCDWLIRSLWSDLTPKWTNVYGNYCRSFPNWTDRMSSNGKTFLCNLCSAFVGGRHGLILFPFAEQTNAWSTFNILYNFTWSDHLKCIQFVTRDMNLRFGTTDISTTRLQKRHNDERLPRTGHVWMGWPVHDVTMCAACYAWRAACEHGWLTNGPDCVVRYCDWLTGPRMCATVIGWRSPVLISRNDRGEHFLCDNCSANDSMRRGWLVGGEQIGCRAMGKCFSATFVLLLWVGGMESHTSRSPYRQTHYPTYCVILLNLTTLKKFIQYDMYIHSMWSETFMVTEFILVHNRV